MENNNTIQKPIMVQIQEFKKDLSNLIQASKLPIFILEPIMKEFAQEANVALQQYTKSQVTEYEKQLSESQNKQSETVEDNK